MLPPFPSLTSSVICWGPNSSAVGVQVTTPVDELTAAPNGPFTSVYVSVALLLPGSVAVAVYWYGVSTLAVITGVEVNIGGAEGGADQDRKDVMLQRQSPY